MILIIGLAIIVVMLLTTDKRDKHLKAIQEQNEQIISLLKEANSKEVENGGNTDGDSQFSSKS